MLKGSKTPALGTDDSTPTQRFARHFEQTLPGVGDRRMRDRRRFEADVLVEPLDGGLPRCWAASEDISPRGMFITCPQRYPLRTLVRLTLRTNHGDSALTGRVVHLLEGAGFGCQFVDLRESQRAVLSFLVAMSRQARPAGRLH